MSMEDVGKALSWKDCQKHVQNHTLDDEGVRKLIRLPQYKEMYRAQRAQNNKKYVKYSDFVKEKFLQFDVEKVQCDGRWKLQAIAKDDEYKHCALFPNHFPYHFEDDIGHFVLWSTDEMKDSEVDEFVEDAYPNQSYLWWRNPAQKRSVPDVWHAQILIKMERMSRRHLILHGYVKRILKKQSYKIPRALLNQMMIFVVA